MQKKELRKSWRRKLAGLLAGTLIAGVFGISMPMTAQAAAGDALEAGTYDNTDPSAIDFTSTSEVSFKKMPWGELQARGASNQLPIEPVEIYVTNSGTSSKLGDEDVTITGYTDRNGSQSVTSNTPLTFSLKYFDVTVDDWNIASGGHLTATIKPALGANAINGPKKSYEDTLVLTAKDVKDGAVTALYLPISFEVEENTYGMSATEGGTDATTRVIDFGKTLVEGFTATEASNVKKEITLTNSSNVPIEIDVTKTQSKYFDITYDPANGKMAASGSPGATVTVTLTPNSSALRAGVWEDDTVTISEKNYSTTGLSVDIRTAIEIQEQIKEITAYTTNNSGTLSGKIDPAKYVMDFNTVQATDDAEGYTLESAAASGISAKTIYVEASGNQGIDEVTAVLGANASSYERVKVQPFKIGAKEFAEVTVQPRANLKEGNYDTTLTLGGGQGVETIVLDVKFKVVKESMELAATKETAASGSTPASSEPVEEIDFGTLNETLNGKEAFTLTVTNKGNVATTVTPSWKTTSNNKFENVSFTYPGNPAAASLDPGAKGTVTVDIKAASDSNVYKAGTYQNTLVLTNGAGEKTEIPVKLTIAESTYSFEVYDKAANGAAVTELDFGKGIAPQYLKPDMKTIYIKNTGNATIYVSALETVPTSGQRIYSTLKGEITAAASTGDLTHADIARGSTEMTIDPGKTMRIEIDVNKATALSADGKAADFNRTLVINAYKDAHSATNASTTPAATKNVNLKFALEKENISFTATPATIDFGVLPSGFDANADVEAKPVTLTNNGNRDLTISNTINITGSTAQYTFTDEDGNALTSPIKLKKGESARVLVKPVSRSLTGRNETENIDNTLTCSANAVALTATPTEGAGSVVGTVTNKAVTKTVKAQYTLEQSSKAIKVLTETVEIPDLPEGYSQTEADAATTEIKVQNTGNVAIELAPLASGTFYTVDENPTEKIPAGETGIYKIKPRLGRTVDAYEAKDIEINLRPSDRNVTGKVTITMNVVARKTEAKVTPATLDFGTYNKMKAAPAAKTVTVENTGNGEITLTQPTATMFEIGDLDKTVIQGGEKATFTVVPKADIKAGEQKETITIKGSNGMTDMTVEATVNVIDEGWKKESDGWYYYKDGAAAKGWLKTGGKWYFLDKSTGLMKTGWLKDNGSWYFFKSSGAMATNEWVKDGGKYYFFKSGGAMASAQWVSWKGDWYYMNAGGSMKTEGWTKSAGKWYYMGKDGKMVKSTSVTVKGKKYNFDKNGVCTNP